MRKYSRVLSLTVSSAFVVIFIWYFLSNRNEFQSLTKLNPILLLLVSLGYVFSIYLSGLFNKIIIEPFDKQISHFEGFKVSLLSSIGNYFGPILGGAGIRAVYFKRKLGLRYTDFISTVYGYYILVFLLTSVLGFVSLIALVDYRNTIEYLLLTTFFLSVFAITLFLTVNRKKPLRLPSQFRGIVGNFLKKISESSLSWQMIAAQPKLLIALNLIVLFNICIFLVINYIEFLLIGVHIGFGPLLLYTSLGICSVLVSLTPGALGIRESIFIFSADVMGVTGPEILAVAIIDRSIQFLVMVFGWILTRVFKNRFEKLSPVNPES